MSLFNLTIAMLAGACVAASQTVEVAEVVSRPLERKSRLPGEFTAYQRVDLHARVSGYAEKVEVDVGSAVKQGQLLVTLSAPEMQARVAEAEARVGTLESQRAEAEARLVGSQSTAERIRAASQTPGAIAANELVLADKAVDAAKAVIASLESSINAAKAAVSAQKELLSYLKVTAPFDGVITERWVHPGALVGPGASGAMLRLEQQSRLRLIVAVPEGEVGGIPRGARVTFTVPAYPGESFTGVVARVPRTMDPKTRTMPVEMDVVNTGGKLAPGMYPEVQWPFKRARPALLVPPGAIVATTERTFVVRVSGGKAEWVTVARGAPAGELTEVFGALQAGDVVVKRANDEIRDGSAVQVKK